jgi:hypothetical protein
MPIQQAWHNTGLIWLTAGLLWLAAASEPSAQPAITCAPASESICQIMAQPEFVSAYRRAYAQSSDPADAVDDVRDNFLRVMLGAGRAGPGGITREIDGALDEALRRAQQHLCGNSAPLASQSATAVAASLMRAAEAHGTRLAPAILGAMTGTTLGATRARGVACLCIAHTFSAIRHACAPGSLPR